MRENYTDLRVIRTLESIKAALVELIEEKGFDAITVKDITTRAKINRGTFYAHYQDKYDLMNKCQEEIIRGLADIGREGFSDVLGELRTSPMLSRPLKPAILIFEYLDKNSAFMKAVLGPKGDLSFQSRLKDYMCNIFYEIMFINQEDLLVPGEYLASYVSLAHIGVIQQWLNSGRKESPQEMARILSTITLNGPVFAAGLKK